MAASKRAKSTKTILDLVLWPVEAWALMLTLGIVHHDVLPAVRPVGYGLTVFALTVVIPLSSATNRIRAEDLERMR